MIDISSLIALLGKDVPLGTISAICIVGVVIVTKRLLSEKDKEIKEAKEDKANIMLILNKVDSIRDEILVFLHSQKEA